jgi:hypothetical protein
MFNDDPGDKEPQQHLCDESEPQHPVFLPGELCAKNEDAQCKDLKLHDFGANSHTLHLTSQLQSGRHRVLRRNSYHANPPRLSVNLTSTLREYEMFWATLPFFALNPEGGGTDDLQLTLRPYHLRELWPGYQQPITEAPSGA